MAQRQAPVLIVDDDEAIGKVLQGLLHQDGIDASRVNSAARALEELALRPIEVVLTDLRMPGMDGMQLLRQIGAQFPEVAVIIMTAHGTVPLAVEAMKAGASDFFLKPFDRDEVLYTVKKALQSAAHAEETPAAPGGLVGDSEGMREVARLVNRAAERGDATVLIRGESGTGKEVAARVLHERSPRKAAPFIKVHCAALPEDLLTNELFGHEKGAFTGATSSKPGRVQLARGGTLFLDEIGDISLSMQVKLLQLLQDRTYEPVGGTTAKAEVRFVCATHRNLEEMIKAGQFREDLFFRLNVLPIFMPALRDRPGDVERLASKFCAGFASTYGLQQLQLESAALRLLAAQRWPGNVRELQNLIERLVVLSDGGAISAADVERQLTREPLPAPEGLDARKQQTEQAALRDALSRTGGNRTKAARLLGIGRRTLHTKLAGYGIE